MSEHPEIRRKPMCEDKECPIREGKISLDAQLAAILEDIRQTKNQMWLTTSYDDVALK
jgi:hypothetical protein